ncbi:SLC13 family permease [Humibacter albus]|uniref:SLC13 family permease n=1 Tax=Humibacter albus TaxID=427754 RepID=UPI0003B4E922|nr:SLC13 family permease [Humibacter albus]
MRSALIGGALLLAGLAAVAFGVYPASDAVVLAARVWPVLLFVVAITIVAELSAEGGLFDVLALWITRAARGSAWLLWLFTVAVAVASTVFLSLDTTAVLLTPIVVAMARRVRLNPLPFALTTVMLANCASLLLPVSNLTNLLAAQRFGAAGSSGVAGFVALSWAPAIVAVLVPAAAVAVLGRRALSSRYTLPVERGVGEGAAPDGAAGDRVLLGASAAVVLVLLPALVSGVPVWVPACGAAGILLLVFAVRRPGVLRLALVPWPTLLFAGGLFVAMGAIESLGSLAVARAVLGAGTGPWGLLRASGAGFVGANAINNLPAYLALEGAARHPLQLMAVLIGVNAGALITPWASLATLLWHSRLSRMGVRVPWRRYMLIGLVVAPVTVAAATLALWLVH